MNTHKTHPQIQTILARCTEFDHLQEELMTWCHRMSAEGMECSEVAVQVNLMTRGLPPLYAELMLLSFYSMVLGDEQNPDFCPQSEMIADQMLGHASDLLNGDVPAPITHDEARLFVLQALGMLNEWERSLRRSSASA